MPTLPASVLDPVRVGLVGAGRIGSSHAAMLRTQVPGATLVAVADAFADNARALGETLSVTAVESPEALFGDDSVEAVVVAATSTAHSSLVSAAAAAGKAVFCEKPAGMTLAEVDRGSQACRDAGVPFQVGFNRRFAPEFAHARRLVVDGVLGTPQLLRSVTRDPGLSDPASVLPGTIFTQTLIHDFDALLWLNPGSEVVSVHAHADALVAPELKDAGLLDTAVVVLRFDNGAMAVAEASFSATYGYDVRGEVFGSRGRVTMGDGATSSLRHSDVSGRHASTARGDVELLGGSYAAELQSFAETVRTGGTPVVGGDDARRALRVALACIESHATGATVVLDKEG